MKRPNILVFVTDQHRADWLSCAGNSVLETPHIDALAQEGTQFTRAYCNTPLCMPSRSTMWTGLPSSVHSARTNGVDLNNAYPALPELLQEAGYRTISVGKLHLKAWHMSPERGNQNIVEYDPQELPECETVWNQRKCTHLPDNYFGLQHTHFLGGHGSYCFGEYFQWLEDEHPEVAKALREKESCRPTTGKGDNYYSTVPDELYYNQWIKRLTIQELEECPADQPFFLWCSFPDPHFPFGPPKPYQDLYDPKQMPLPIAWEDSRQKMNELYHQEYYDSRNEESIDGGPCGWTLEQIQETKALAYGMVRSIDDCVGEVMQALEASGRRQDTVVLFLADHGELMGDHGMYCKGPFHYEGLLRVPMIASWPGVLQQGVKSDALVSLLDLMPTLLDLAGVAYPGGTENVSDWEGPFEGKELYKGVSRLPGRSLVPLMKGDPDWKDECVLVEDDDDIRHVNVRTLITRRYKLTVYQDKPYGELFDLEQDPEERNNLWDDPAAEQLKASLLLQLVHKMTQQQDRTTRRIGIA